MLFTLPPNPFIKVTFTKNVSRRQNGQKVTNSRPRLTNSRKKIGECDSLKSITTVITIYLFTAINTLSINHIRTFGKIERMNETFVILV